MTDREAMQQALEALEEINKLSIGENAICLPAEIDGALDALRERLAQQEQCQYPDCKCATENPCLKGLAQPEQEPVAWCQLTASEGIAYFDGKPMIMVGRVGNEIHPAPLYTIPPQGIYYTPPQRTWVGSGDIEDSNAYLTPPQRKPRQWQGLARLEFQKAVEGLEDLEDCWIAIESALREKNT